MNIVWDERKRKANLVKHGLDFAFVPFEFFQTARIAVARRGRFQALGMLEGRAVIIIFARLGTEALSIVSMRSASATERRRF